jgi:protein subunit release factor A
MDLHSLPNVMDGDIDKLVDALANAYQAQLLSSLGDAAGE